MLSASGFCFQLDCRFFLICLANSLRICCNYVIKVEVNAMPFSNDVELLRKKLFLSQEDFAKEIGVSFTTVNRWESGKVFPNYKTLKKLADYCSEY